MGVLVLALASIEIARQSLGLNAWLLAALTVVTRRLTWVRPGRPTTSPISQVFAFTSVILFGAAAATIMVVVAEIWASWHRPDRWRVQSFFDVSEAAVSTWVAGQVFFVVAALEPSFGWLDARALALLPVVAMAATYVALHDGLTVTAAAFAAGKSPFAVWRTQLFVPDVTSFVLVALLTLGAYNYSRFYLDAIAVLVPLGVLGYLVYGTKTSRASGAIDLSPDLQQLYQATIEALAVAVDAKDQITHGHIRRVQRHAIALAKAFGVDDPSELKALEAASLLHDIGKLAVPDYVLNKPGALTKAEFDVMKMHAAKGALVLGAVGFPYPVVPIVRHHHEQWDGRGYPDGLAGEQIPLGARILSVVDCFDALTSDRPYRRKVPDETALELLRARSAIFYDPNVVETFISLVPQLRAEDAELEPASAAAPECCTTAVPEPAEGTRALKVDLTTPDAIGRLLRSRVSSMLPGAEFCLFVPDPSGVCLLPVHASARLRPIANAVQLRMGEGLAGWVAVNRHTIINSDPDLDFPTASTELGLHRCVCTPVFAFGTIAGVLTAYTCEETGFSGREIRLVGAIAQEIGMEFSRHDRALANELSAAANSVPLADVG